MSNIEGEIQSRIIKGDAIKSLKKYKDGYFNLIHITLVRSTKQKLR